MSGIAESWRTFRTHVRPRRLFYEDPGVKGPLWFGKRPDSDWHIWANILRIVLALTFSPTYIFIPHTKRSFKEELKRLLWGIEWAKTPDALLLEPPGSLFSKEGKATQPLNGKYAVTGSKPTWLWEVKFKGTTIVSQNQLWYGEKEGKSKSTPNSLGASACKQYGLNPLYTAISYSMESAKALFDEAGSQLDPQPEIVPGGKRLYSLQNRKNISLALLNEYARARRTIDGKQDGVELIWLDELCLSDQYVTNEEESDKQRSTELGKLADIFKRADQVVVFCHIPNCDHTDTDCPWGKRLFTLGEILHARIVHVMTRNPRLESQITIFSGQDFRTDMQTRAAKAEMWHLYNIMQHATNSGAVSWQSAIHSLVVEAIHRDEAGNFHDHVFLGKALNGLLPRRSQLNDLRGVNGWADLAWLLELNQGYYNTTLLVAICKLADPYVKEYRWWGKPIAPKEGSERLEALVTSFPAKIRGSDDRPAEPVLSIVGPKSIALNHWLQRDSAGLYNNPEVQGLKRCMLCGLFIFFVIGGISSVSKPVSSAAIIYVTSTVFVIFELLVGTIFVEKDMWVVFDSQTAPGQDFFRWLQSQDPCLDDISEWGSRQLIPRWDSPSPAPPNLSTFAPTGSSLILQPYTALLVNPRTCVWTSVAVTSRPNDMVILAVHGSGITCMLLGRNEKELRSTIATKVGMVNLPPFSLAQAEDSGTVYVGGGIKATTDPPVYPNPAAYQNHDLEKFGNNLTPLR